MTTLPINESQTCKLNIFSVIRTILLNIIIMTAYIEHCLSRRQTYIHRDPIKEL